MERHIFARNGSQVTKETDAQFIVETVMLVPAVMSTVAFAVMPLKFVHQAANDGRPPKVNHL